MIAKSFPFLLSKKKQLRTKVFQAIQLLFTIRCMKHQLELEIDNIILSQVQAGVS